MRFPSKDHLERAKISFELLIYLAVVLVVAFALCRADFLLRRVAQVFHSAGIEVSEVTIWGIKLKAATDIVSTVQGDISEVTKKYAEAISFLECQKARNCTTDKP